MTYSNGFESGVTGWTNTSCSLTQDATHIHTGSHAGKMVTTGTPTQAYTRASMTGITPGSDYTLEVWLYSETVLPNVNVAIDWYDGSGTYLSTSNIPGTQLSAGVWMKLSGTGIAPDDAARADFGPTLTDNPATGTVVWLDDVMFALQVFAITATQDSAWPPRIIVEATGLAIGDVVSIARVVGGDSTVIRGADEVTVDDPALVIFDGEQPFGLPMTYTLTVNGDLRATSSSITSTLAGGKVVLSDAITGLAVETVILAWPTKDTPRTSTKYTVGGRTIVVSSPRGDAEQQVQFITEAESSRQQMLNLLQGATGGIILVRQPGGYYGVDGWYQVDSDSEARAAQDGRLERRLWTLDLIDSDGWPDALQARGWTLGDIESAYEGLTLADLAGDFGTLLDVAVFDWGAVI